MPHTKRDLKAQAQRLEPVVKKLGHGGMSDAFLKENGRSRSRSTAW